MTAMSKAGAAALGVGAALVLSLTAHAGTIPDFSGSWTPENHWKFQPPPDGLKPGPMLDMPGHVHHGHRVDPNGKDISANEWYGNYHDPILRPATAAAVKAAGEASLKGNTIPTAQQTCSPGGVPGVFLFGDPIRFLQTPKEVTIIYDRDHQVRHVYMNQPHSAHPTPSWYGESVGHYEGDTLVIDTIGQNNKALIDFFSTPHSEQLHVIERIRVVDGGKTLQDVFTVEDPKTYTKPWHAMVHYRRGDAPMKEIVCAEITVDMFTHKPLPMPRDFTPDF